MASLVGGSASAQHAGLCKGVADMEDEDDLFEIDLDSVDSIPQTQYYWDGYFTGTGNALLANCLLPVTDISRAIPMVSKALPSSERTGKCCNDPTGYALGAASRVAIPGGFWASPKGNETNVQSG